MSVSGIAPALLGGAMSVRSRRRADGAAFVLLLALALNACGSGDERAASGSPAARPASSASSTPRPPPTGEQARPSRPPEVAFVAAQPWQSTREGSAPLEPPPLETWRALVSQHRPQQTKTPRWQPLAPTDTVELAMPPGSRFRCVVTPLQVTAEANDFGTKLKAWVLARSLLCSGDDFRSWTEHGHGVRLPADGERAITSEATALLRERDAGSDPRHTFVLVRADEESRAAATGPPRVLPGVAVDED
jgi:hypothetical protein